jgi:uncharacterized protein (DUF2147 family)
MNNLSQLKKIFATLVLLLVVTVCQSALAQTDPIEGAWMDANKEAKINIFKATDGKFYGKISWLKEPLRNGKPKLDENNPEQKLKSREIVGLEILKGFVKDGDKYTDGTIYDPKSGKTYSCKMTRKGNSLDIRGYVGISLFGRTTTWTKTN